MKCVFIDSENVYISLISSYNTYMDLDKYSQTVNNKKAIHVLHINSNEEYYLVETDRNINTSSIEEISAILMRPLNKSVFWPIDFVIKNNKYFLVYPLKFVPPVTNLEIFANDENLLGFEHEHMKKLINNLVDLFENMYNHGYLYHQWNEQAIYVNQKDFSILAEFSDLITLGLESTIEMSVDTYPSDCFDPYVNKTGQPSDYYSEMYAINCLIFKLLIGKYPYEGKLLDGIPKYSDNDLNVDKTGCRVLTEDKDYAYWLNTYLKNTVFLFDENDTRNSIGGFSHEKIYLQRWESLTENMKKMLRNFFSFSNVQRDNGEVFVITPLMWKEALENFDYKLK